MPCLLCSRTDNRETPGTTRLRSSYSSRLYWKTLTLAWFPFFGLVCHCTAGVPGVPCFCNLAFFTALGYLRVGTLYTVQCTVYTTCLWEPPDGGSVSLGATGTNLLSFVFSALLVTIGTIYHFDISFYLLLYKYYLHKYSPFLLSSSGLFLCCLYSTEAQILSLFVRQSFNINEC